MPRFSHLLCFVLMIVTAYSYADMKLSIKGLSGELADNVDARVSLIEPNKINNSPNFKDRKSVV